MATIEVRPQQIQQGGRVSLFATPARTGGAGGTTEPTAADATATVAWEVLGFGPLPGDPQDPARAVWDVPGDQQHRPRDVPQRRCRGRRGHGRPHRAGAAVRRR